MSALADDFKFAVRTLKTKPGSSLMVIGMLALGPDSWLRCGPCACSIRCCSASAPHPQTYAIVILGVVCVALLANLVPARRAAAVDPMRALRFE